jgi:hypothetical protein
MNRDEAATHPRGSIASDRIRGQEGNDVCADG